MTEATDQTLDTATPEAPTEAPTEATTEATEAEQEPVTVEAIAETIAEFKQYRERLVTETLTAAKKAKMSKKDTMAKLEPELEKIDAVVQTLQTQHDAMVATN